MQRARQLPSTTVAWVRLPIAGVELWPALLLLLVYALVYIQFATQPAGRAAIVGDCHHGGDVGSQPAGRGQRRVQAVSAPEGDDALSIR